MPASTHGHHAPLYVSVVVVVLDVHHGAFTVDKFKATSPLGFGSVPKNR